MCDAAATAVVVCYSRQSNQSQSGSAVGGGNLKKSRERERKCLTALLPSHFKSRGKASATAAGAFSLPALSHCSPEKIRKECFHSSSFSHWDFSV